MKRTITESKIPRRALVALLCAAAAGGALAQDDTSRSRPAPVEGQAATERAPGLPGADTTAPVPPPVGQVRPIRLACCRCLGETLSPIKISTGQPVPWTVDNGKPTVVQSMVPGWHGWNNLPPTPPGSQWIGPVGGASAAPGTYTYELKINVPKCVIPGAMTVSGKFWADNSGTVSLLPPTGPALPAVSTPNYPMGFTTGNFANFSYTVPNAVGVYTLKIVTQNQSGPTGFLMDANVFKRCVTEGAGPVGDFDPPPTK